MASSRQVPLAHALADAESRLAAGAPLLAMLDLDGTLADFKVDPRKVTVHRGTRPVLRRLAASPRARVVILTGRQAEEARRIVGVEGVEVVGMHGRERIGPDGKLRRRPIPKSAARALDRLFEEGRAFAAALPGSRLEDKRPGGVAFHTRGASDAGAAKRAEATFTRLVRKELPQGLEIVHGKRVVEARVAGRHKGDAARELAEAARKRRGQSPVILFAGDDVTDEDAHRSLQPFEALTILVAARPRPTAARTRVPDIDAMIAVLRRLAARL